MRLPRKRAAERYDAAFYADRDARTKVAAQAVLSHLFRRLQVKSVCDVGCGVGTWLATALELGVERVKGFEGTWVDRSAFVVDAGCVVTQDLESRVQDNQRYDLAISLEVAEHLGADRAASFVQDLTALADTVLFSAAIPNQGGTNHVNERWQSYWADLFEAQGYDAFDAVRPAIWHRPEIMWWYRQNTLVYARYGSDAAGALADCRLRDRAMIDLVHPELFALKASPRPLESVRMTLSSVFRGERHSS